MPSRSRSASPADRRSDNNKSTIERGNAEIPSLFVRNMPSSASPSDLREMFGKYGDVRDVHMPRDFHTSSYRGFGFVEFKNWHHAEEAVRELNGKQFDGRILEITFAQSNRRTPKEMRAKDNDGGRGSDSRRRSRSRGSDHSRDRRRRDGSRDRKRGRGHSERRSSSRHRRTSRRRNSSRSISRSPKRIQERRRRSHSSKSDEDPKSHNAKKSSKRRSKSNASSASSHNSVHR